jgi:EAL domain-containing protein (putative c-di-GMP-specific phosphodiesterase class I)/ActR/RegA family two-component response regulator
MSSQLVTGVAGTDSAKALSAYVLDDEADIGTLVCQLLAKSGFAPQQFTSPAPFFVELEHAAPDLVVLDLALGQSDAVEVIRRLEVLEFKGKVLLISGRDEGTLIEITQIGERRGLAMLPPLAKPFRAHDLRSRLAVPEAEPQQDAGVRRSPQDSTARKIAVLARDALRNNWLELWYQPKIDLKSLTVCGAEALLRARHPEHGIIYPPDLLPPAGDPDYQPLSAFVLKRAMADWRRFAYQRLPLKLAVNMPASVILAPEFISLVRQYLPAAADFPGLIIEITEDEVIREPELIREIATQLKLYNVWISIDDFGSGYASLSRLKDLPFVEVKIDRSFVDSCASNQLKHGLCQTIVDLAHRFGASVCAEGVETGQDLRSLVNMGCNAAQGFLFAKPMPADQLAALMLSRSPVAKGFAGRPLDDLQRARAG